MELQYGDVPKIVPDAYQGACATKGCHNEGVVFDAPSYQGTVFPIYCGVCGVDFSPKCKAVAK